MRHLQVKIFAVLSRAVEEGIGYGWNRAHKYTDTPSPEAVREAIYRAVLDEIDDYFEFDDYDAEPASDTE